ncbi:hypothetical protein RB195_024409 [Necator americanus]|uniref:Uncharacterized protein n=1 Tax=Necator americanus TaxID=51031 RepID=A0ABR1EN77_NECAM
MRLCTTAGLQRTQTLDRYCSRPTETATDRNKDALYNELNMLISKTPRQQAVIAGIDANAKMGLEQQSDGLGRCFYPMEQTSYNENRLIDLCEQTNLIIASTFERNHRRDQPVKITAQIRAADEPGGGASSNEVAEMAERLSQLLLRPLTIKRLVGMVDIIVFKCVQPSVILMEQNTFSIGQFCPPLVDRLLQFGQSLAVESTPSFSRTRAGPPCTSMMLHDNSLFSQKNRDLQSKADNYRIVRKVRNEKLKKGLVLSLNPPDVRIRANFRRCDLWNSSCSASLNTTAQTSTSAIDSKIERAMTSAITLCAFCCTAGNTHERSALHQHRKLPYTAAMLMRAKCAFLRQRDRRRRKLWIVSAHAPTETAEDNSKGAFYDELNALMSKIPSQQVVIVGTDANAKM